MTREEAIEKVRKMSLPKETVEILEALAPELRESEDERTRKALIETINCLVRGDTQFISEDTRQRYIAYLEKQKENIEKEYVFRPLAGTDINTAVLQAIRRANEGDRLVLAFNGAYIPVRKDCDANKIVDIYDTFIEKQKEQKPSEWSRQSIIDALTKWLTEKIAPLHKKSLDGTITEREEMFEAALLEMRSLVNSPDFQIGKDTSAEWSEKETKDLVHILKVLDDCYAYGKHDLSKTDHENLVNTLKSLRPQYHGDVTMTEAYKMGFEAGKVSSWKPSKAQMVALSNCVIGNEYKVDALVSLWAELKKLK